MNGKFEDCGAFGTLPAFAAFRLRYENPEYDDTVTARFATIEEARGYYLGVRDFGDTEEHPGDNPQRCIAVDEVAP